MKGYLINNSLVVAIAVMAKHPSCIAATADFIIEIWNLSSILAEENCLECHGLHSQGFQIYTFAIVISANR